MPARAMSLHSREAVLGHPVSDCGGRACARAQLRHRDDIGDHERKARSRLEPWGLHNLDFDASVVLADEGEAHPGPHFRREGLLQDLALDLVDRWPRFREPADGSGSLVAAQIVPRGVRPLGQPCPLDHPPGWFGMSLGDGASSHRPCRSARLRPYAIRSPRGPVPRRLSESRLGRRKSPPFILVHTLHPSC